MKRRNFFKNKLQMFIYILMFIIFMIGFIYFGKKDYTVKNQTDNEKFAEEHTEVSEDNIYSYIMVNDALNYVKSDDVIILFGVANDEYVSYYANILNDVAKNCGIDNIYYYDINTDRDENNATYRYIVNYLENYIYYFDNNEGEMYAPALLVKKDGNIIYWDSESSIRMGNIKAEDYWNDYQINLKKNTLETVFYEYLGRKIDG